MTTQTALITGASSGIGKALAHQFASHGYNIIAVASKESRLEAATAELRASHDVLITGIIKDLTQPDVPQELHDELRLRGIAIDVLVNDAGIGQGGPSSIHRLTRTSNSFASTSSR